MRYKILEHTGDTKIKVFGKTKEELFLNAMLGMGAILNATRKEPASPELQRGEQSAKCSVKIQSSDINALLVAFLSEVNYLRQVNMEIYDKIKFTDFSDTALEAKLEGSAVERFGEDIKAVTFHGLDIKKNEQGLWEAAVVFDI